LLIFYLLLLTIVDKNIKSLVLLFLVTLILLFVWFTFRIRLLSQGILIVDLLVLYLSSIKKRDIWKIKYEEGYKSVGRRKKLFMDNFKVYLKNRDMEKLEKYNYDTSDELIEKKINQDANDLYKYSKVRFYGYGNIVTSMYGKWTIYDGIFLLVSVFVLSIMYLYW
jgi:hypothetical protein